MRVILDIQLVAHFALLSCGSATQLTFATLAQARAFSPASLCAFHNPLEPLDSSCWKPSVFGKYNLYCFALPWNLRSCSVFFFQSIIDLKTLLMRKERQKVTYRPNHELSRFSLIYDKQTELRESAGNLVPRVLPYPSLRSETGRRENLGIRLICSVANVPNDPLWSQKQITEGMCFVGNEPSDPTESKTRRTLQT